MPSGRAAPPGIDDEPTAAQGLADGADLVLFSGDKLLGGPQCGIMVGRREAIGRIETDPLMRALRVDKMTLAALEATLRLAMDPEHAVERIPLWTMIAAPLPLLRARAERLAEIFRDELGLERGGLGFRIVHRRRQRADPADTHSSCRRLSSVSDSTGFGVGGRLGQGLATG